MAAVPGFCPTVLSDDQKWHPTAKGIMILPTLLPQVINGVEALCGVTEVIVVMKIRKSSREELQIAIREYEGTRYGEIRAWYWAEGAHRSQAKGSPSSRT